MISCLRLLLPPALGAFAFSFVVSGASVAHADLKGYWSFDEGAGSTVGDASGLGNNGNIEGTPMWTGGFSGGGGDGALNFTANGQRVNMGNPTHLAADVAGSRTTSIWFQPSVLPTSRYAIWGKSYSGTGTLNVTAAGGFQQYYGPELTGPPFNGNAGTHTNQVTAGGVIAAGNWYHIVHMRDSAGNTQQFFVNGQPIGTAAGIVYNPTGVSTAPFYVGYGYTGTSLGVLDDAAIWNEALSPGEIATLYKARADSANELYGLGYDVAVLDSLFGVFEAGGSLELDTGDGYVWQYYDNGGDGGLMLGDTGIVTGDFRGLGDENALFLLLDASGTGLVALGPPPLTPEPGTFLLFGLVVTGAAGSYAYRRRTA